MKPSFEHHLPRGDAKDDDQGDSEPVKKVKTEPVKVQVELKKELSEKQKENKLNSHQHLQHLAETEPWQELVFYLTVV